MKRFFLPFNFSIYMLAVFLSTSYTQGGIDTTATWIFKTGGPVYSSPTYDNGFIFIGSDDSNMYCLNSASGSINWTFRTSGLIRCKPAVADSIVYFESEDGNVYALNKVSGSEVWKTYVGNTINKRVLPSLAATAGNSWDYMQSSPCVDSGVVYVGSGDSSLYALDSQTGVLQWKVKTGNVIRSSPCVVGAIVYVGSWDGYIYAFNKTDGSITWKYNTGGRIQESPRIYNGTLYSGSRSGYFYAIDAMQGTLVWKYYYSSNYPFVESSAVIENGVVYVGSSDLGLVFAFDAATGSVKWSCMVPGDSWSSPFYKAGKLYIGIASYGNTMTAQKSGALIAIIASTGSIDWSFNCGATPFIGGFVSSPTVDGHIMYCGSLDGNVYAVDTSYITPPKWCAADFVNPNYGKQGFYIPEWASGSIDRNSFRSITVLRGTVSISSASPVFAVQRDSIPVQNGEFKAHTISFMVKVPDDMPNHGVVKFYVTDGIHDSVAVIDTIGTQIKQGIWTNLWLTKLDSLATIGKFDLTKSITIGAAVYYPSPYDTTTWNGTIDFDGLWLYGVSFSNQLINGVHHENGTPNLFHLDNNYPNPFNPTTTIGYQVLNRSRITLQIYDILGRELMTLVDRIHNPGTYTVILDASHLASGVYFDRLTSGTSCEIKTMVLIK